MAGRGPSPQRTHTRTRNDHRMTKLVKRAKPLGPTLPKGALGRDADGELIDWHPMTRRWWNHWRRSPQAARMLSEADWDFLLDTALMHHAMWHNKRWEFASEIRLRVAKFGATPEDRLRLRVEIETPQEAPVGPASATVASLEDRRGRLLKAV